MKKSGSVIFGISFVLGVFLMVYGTVCSIHFKKNCKGYLKRAADANTVELAKAELLKAVDYLEESGLTEGSTHVIYSLPKCDLTFWYKNLKASLDELNNLPKDADQLTVSNHLLKLRETLVDQGERGPRVTAPPSVHVYPYQVPYRIAGTVSLLGLFSGGIWAIAQYEEHKARTNTDSDAQAKTC